MNCVECGTSLSNRTIIQGIALCGGCMSKLPEDQQLPQGKLIRHNFREIVTKPVADEERR